MTIRCDFCRKAAAEVFHLVRGRTAHICDQCIAEAAKVIEEVRSTAAATAPAGKDGSEAA